MNILNRLITSLFQSINKKTGNVDVLKKNDDAKSSMNPIDREQEVFGTDNLQQQKLFEKWVVKDEWLLKTEAIPLLFGLDPDKQNCSEENKKKISDLWVHAQQCVEQGLLVVIDKTIESNRWQVNPYEVYKWAKISRVEIPEHFNNLMQFITSVVKKTEHADIQNKDFNNDNERILGAALAILAAHPQQCRTGNGKVNTDEILKILEEKGTFWFGEQEPVLSKSDRASLINRWLDTVN